MYKITIFCAIFLGMAITQVQAICTTIKQDINKSVLKYVNPLIGTGAHGHTFLGVSVPFGAVQVGPSNHYKGWDWCSGYHSSDSILIGFAHLHLSGTGCADLGDILIMPTTGDKNPSIGTQNNPEAGYASKYNKESFVTHPSYFKMMIPRYHIKAELTASERVGMHRYTFLQKDAQKRIIINLETANGKEQVVKTSIEKKDKFTIIGCRYSKGWAKNQKVYFALKVNQPIVESDFYEGTEHIHANWQEGTSSKAILSFGQGSKELLIKVGISPVSVEGALLNIEKEISHWDFEKVVKEGNRKWLKELNVATVETNDEKEKEKFYTARYHTMIAPSLFNDVNGNYRGADAKNHKDPGFNIYTVFSLWDTYRAAHPLYTLLNQDRVPDFIHTMLKIYDEQGKLPIWHLMGCETDIMVGYHAVPVIVDAYLKGYRNFDTKKALQAMLASSNREDNASSLMMKYGYIPSDQASESVAKVLEYCIDDWCIARFAKALGNDSVYQCYSRRALLYQHVFNPQNKFFQGKSSSGEWVKDFNPCVSKHRNDVYCEGNAWQYAWLVPQDVEGLVRLHGGDEKFVAKLDSLFQIQDTLGENASMDITGLIGMYAHGNEPSHHTIYLYPFAGQQWKTAEKARKIMKEMYLPGPEGIIGNEDCGQMSAWYILSSLGFYPVNPANGVYVFGSPVFDKVTIKLTDDKKFTIETISNSDENIYIDKVELNGVPYSKSYILHADIVAGGNLKFYMSNVPNRSFGATYEDRPRSIPLPLISEVELIKQ